jgi:hypothetical protein
MAGKLPLLLIGPILRRVTPRSVSVFIATSEPARINLKLYEGFVSAATPPAVFAEAEDDTRSFCKHFHAVVITLALQGAKILLPGTRYSYDVSVASAPTATSAGSGPLSLLALDLLHDQGTVDANAPSHRGQVDTIGYADGQLPSFVTVPEQLTDLVLVHASCRLPHGEGHPSLQYIDDLIDDLLHGPAAQGDPQRTKDYPHMLLLTGDQIYSDDVALALLPGITSLGFALMDGAEEVPSPVPPTDANVRADLRGPFKLSVLPAGFRQKLTGRAGFTSYEASCHLIGLSEWLAMYCIVWNPRLWPELAVVDALRLPPLPAELTNRLVHDFEESRKKSPNAKEVLQKLSPDSPEPLLTDLYAGTEEAKLALREAFTAFIDQKDRLADFALEVGKVRRLLANVPVYMIVDDHEVTDDWFMTGAMRAANIANPFGQALVRNALAAYTICQAWGSDPAVWASEHEHQALLDGIAGMYGAGSSGGLPADSGCEQVDQALGLKPGTPPQPGTAPRFDFSFKIDGPQFRVRVLDTRTRRRYDWPEAAPGLLTPDALNQQLPAESMSEDHVLIVVSPAPVFGPPLVSEIGGPIAVTTVDLMTFAREQSRRRGAQALTGLENGKPTGLQYFDAEHWGVHPDAFESLLKRLSQFPRVVVLGGDVHYGAAYAMDWTGDGRVSRIIHFTSSGTRKAWFDVVRNLMLLNGMGTGLQKLGMPMVRLGWSEPPELDGDLDTEPPLAKMLLDARPVLLSDELFRSQHRFKPSPEWLWRASPILDSRPPSLRPLAAQVPGVEVDDAWLTGDEAVHHFGDLMRAHAQALDSVAVARGLQFLNNVGLVRFTRKPDPNAADKDRPLLWASQALYSLRARPPTRDEKADAYIVHEALLEPTPVEAPTAVGPRPK